MVVEYILLLLMSSMILAASFGAKTGPVKMLQNSTPYLGKHIEEHLITGDGFINNKKTPISWKK